MLEHGLVYVKLYTMICELFASIFWQLQFQFSFPSIVGSKCYITVINIIGSNQCFGYIHPVDVDSN